jgi:hypothetical protein
MERPALAGSIPQQHLLAKGGRRWTGEADSIPPGYLYLSEGLLPRRGEGGWCRDGDCRVATPLFLVGLSVVVWSSAPQLMVVRRNICAIHFQSSLYYSSSSYANHIRYNKTINKTHKNPS